MTFWRTPGEQVDVSSEHPDVVERLRAAYDAWLRDVSASRGYGGVRFALGSDAQPHVTLTRQDWRMITADGWGRDQGVVGQWLVEAATAGPYDITVTLAKPAGPGATVRISFEGMGRDPAYSRGSRPGTLRKSRLARGRGRIPCQS